MGEARRRKAYDTLDGGPPSDEPIELIVDIFDPRGVTPSSDPIRIRAMADAYKRRHSRPTPMCGACDYEFASGEPPKLLFATKPVVPKGAGFTVVSGAICRECAALSEEALRDRVAGHLHMSLSKTSTAQSPERQKKLDDAERGAPTIVTNLANGEKLAARMMPRPLDMLARRQQLELERERGGRPAAAVPCGSCRECCWHNRVDVNPAAERPEDLAHLDLIDDPSGRKMLRKRADGACVHLGPNGCSVYEHRPRACRTYDCRMFALAGLGETFDGGHKTPVWSSLALEPLDKKIAMTLQFIAGEYVDRRGGKFEPIEALNAALEMVVPQIPAMQEADAMMNKLSPAEQDEMVQALLERAPPELAAKMRKLQDAVERLSEDDGK